MFQQGCFLWFDQKITSLKNDAIGTMQQMTRFGPGSEVGRAACRKMTRLGPAKSVMSFPYYCYEDYSYGCGRLMSPVLGLTKLVDPRRC